MKTKKTEQKTKIYKSVLTAAAAKDKYGLCILDYKEPNWPTLEELKGQHPTGELIHTQAGDRYWIW